jgi:hypothetical protein
MPQASLPAVLDWICQFRDDIGQTYTIANPLFSPSESCKGHTLPFAPLTTSPLSLQKLCCVCPSRPAGDSPHRTTNSQPLAHPLRPLQPSLPADKSCTLSAEDEAELLQLAQDLLHSNPIAIGNEISMIYECRTVVSGKTLTGRKPLDNAEQTALLAALRNRRRQQSFALAIAQNLGWAQAVEEVGVLSGTQSAIYGLQNLAEANGCMVSLLIVAKSPKRQWAGAAGWLAWVWKAAGSPRVSLDDWLKAVEQSKTEY